MLFSSFVKKAYKNNVCIRCNERDTAFYFSYSHFEGISCEPYRFKNYWGDELLGRFYIPEHPIENRIIIFEHGFGAGHRSYMREIVKLVQHGYLVFAYDRTGCALSPGDTTMGLTASLSDLDFCLRALKADPNYKDYDFSVVGHSWGGFSSMNISAYHPDVSHIVAMSGFSSIEKMHSQLFGGILSLYRSDVLSVEKENNPDYFNASAENSLKNSNAKVLIVYSYDDPVVSSKIHFEPLRKSLADKENIRFLALTGKAHNPNYTESAVKYLTEYQKIAKKKAKKLKTDEEKRAFVNSFDWMRMTEQDDAVWDEIFRTLDS